MAGTQLVLPPISRSSTPGGTSRSSTPAAALTADSCCRCEGDLQPGEEAGEALHFDVKNPPKLIEVRCCDVDVTAAFAIGGGTLPDELAGQEAFDRKAPWRGPMLTVELKDDRGRPTGSVCVTVSWTPHPRPPHRLCVTVCRAQHLKQTAGQHLDPYVTVRVGTTTLRTQTVKYRRGREPVWAPYHPTGPAAQGTPRTAIGHHKLPILYDAAGRGDLAGVKRALAHGVDVAAAPDGRFGNTALHRAAAAGHASVVKELLRTRADINVKTDDGWTPYHCACHSGENGACMHAPAAIQPSPGKLADS